MKKRLLTGVVAGALFLAMLTLGRYWFAVTITVMAWIGFEEFMRMFKLTKVRLLMWTGRIFLLLYVFVWNIGETRLSANFSVLVWTLLLLLLVYTVVSKNRTTIEHAAFTFIGLIYIGFGFHYMIFSRNVEEGLYWTLLIFVCIWAADSGAYFSGRIFGRRKLWPQISPNKTVEGAIGGIALSIIAAIGFAIYNPELLSAGYAILLGAVISVVGQAGDLIQSAYKRVKNIKDTGQLLPGHGGVLDRTDSWLIVFPFVYLFSLIPY
ncbi:phosphatidate cytidylyltransferase [Paenibacillus senegalensis]|uniref:phosphatidate cytidylyltransferase n=1 Tax=Paenibacillus senegalensis TaxID=1465766 RepID=UPI0002881AD4|nr:phosphatidate cytidylyltransferase [Paenibacillus senegalensis]